MNDAFLMSVARILGLLLAIILVWWIANGVHSIIWMDPDKEA